MFQNFKIGDFIFVSKNFAKNNIKRGDTVLFYKNNKTFIKRIIGLPGDKIVLQPYSGRVLFINDQSIKRNINGDYDKNIQNTFIVSHDNKSYKVIYNNNRFDTNFNNNQKLDTWQEPISIPQNHYFVLGDNRGNSIDSRNPEIGFIPSNRIIGKFRAILWNRYNYRFGFSNK